MTPTDSAADGYAEALMTAEGAARTSVLLAPPAMLGAVLGWKMVADLPGTDRQLLWMAGALAIAIVAMAMFFAMALAERGKMAATFVAVHALASGAAVGASSQFYAARGLGFVGRSVLAIFAAYTAMSVLHSDRSLRSMKRPTKSMIAFGCGIGLDALVASVFGEGQYPWNGTGILGVCFEVAVVALFVGCAASVHENVIQKAEEDGIPRIMQLFYGVGASSPASFYYFLILWPFVFLMNPNRTSSQDLWARGHRRR